MYRKIIVGHDLHDGGSDALVLGKQLAEITGAQLVVAGVFPISGPLPLDVVPRGFEAEWREQEQDTARELQAIADYAGAEAEAFPSSSPARGLHDLAKEIDADLVVVGSSRHSKVGEILAGNVGLGLLHGSPCAVALAPRDYRRTAEHGLGTVTVGFDGSEEAGLALLSGIDLARASGATLKLVTVAEPPIVAMYGAAGGSGQAYQALKTAIEDQKRAQLNEAKDTVPSGIKVEATLVSGDAAAKLAEATRSNQTILILGSRAYGPMRRVLLGSVSTALMHSAPCPVLVHPRGTKVELATAHSIETGSAA